VRLSNVGRSVAAIAVAAVVVLPVVTACGSGKPRTNPAASPSGMTDAQLQVLVNDLVACIRQNGAPGMPDVRVEHGRVVSPDENSADEATKRNAESALEACKSYKDRIPPAAFEKGQENSQRQDSERRQATAADVPALRRFAECMRQNGVPEWPDPKGDGSFPASSPITSEGKSPRLIAGFQACRQYWDGSLTFTP
jgi:hypothetical protein